MPLRPIAAVPVALCLAAGPAAADGRAGIFDYYVLALSWSPNWCATEGADRDAAQCDTGSGTGWTLHGLWPQYESGWPDYCVTTARDPSRRDTAAMADIMGSSGLAWYQWNKHGVCSGLSSADYFALARVAWDRVVRPPEFDRLQDSVALPAALVEEAFLRDNPGLGADGITVTCTAGMIDEVRLCLSRDLEFRRCAPDVRRDCTLDDALMAPVP